MKLAFLGVWAVVLATLAIAVLRHGMRSWIVALWQGLHWQVPATPVALPPVLAWLTWLAHAGGLCFLWRLNGLSFATAIPLGLATAVVLLAPQGPHLAAGEKLHPGPPAALLLPYAVAALNRLGIVPASDGFVLLHLTTAAVLGYAALTQVERYGPRLRRLGYAPAAALLLLTVGFLWAAWEYLGRRTHGVTGSDPYCYAQMAVDIATRGDARHAFALFSLVRNLGIPWWPIVHVGYYPPANPSGLAATVWPAGWPAMLAVFYRLLGEVGLYVAAPLIGLFSLGATAGLVLALWPVAQPRRRWLGAALAVLILATSREQVLQLLVPMADVPAQAATVVTMGLALLAGARRSWPLALLAGLALGLAYDIRHTQVFLGPALAVALWAGDWHAWVRRVAAAAIGAMLAALPDLVYHAALFGSPWIPESPELNLIRWEHGLPNALRMAAAMAARAEYGLLLPLLAFGAWRLARRRARIAVVLALWVGILGGVQLFYGPLRWRDLLSLSPALALICAYGAVEWLHSVQNSTRWRSEAAVGVGLLLSVLLAWRSGGVMAWPLQAPVTTFGYLTAEQRQAFDDLGQVVEPGAVIGTALNSGPVELYTGRQTFRPGDWSTADLEVFLTAMAAAGRPVYLLDDGNEQAAVITRLRAEGRLQPVQRLGVPLWGDAQALSGILYQVEGKPGALKGS